MRRFRAILALSACALTALLTLSVAAGQAKVASSAGCQLGSTSQPFLAWGDATQYELVPGGNFSGSLSGWSLSSAAGLSAGAEPWAVTGSSGTQSLELGPAATAVSPATCINLLHPTVRLFARSVTPGATLELAEVLDDRPGSPAVRIGTVSPSADWAPSQALATSAPALPPDGGTTADIALRLTAGRGTVQVDDVFVDPWRSG